jgi:acyl-CoA synthetase (AMP-forming)/AMP-acid ligase II
MLASANTRTPNGNPVTGGGGQADTDDPQTQDQFLKADQEADESAALEGQAAALNAQGDALLNQAAGLTDDQAHSAVPTIHQAILARAARHQEIIASCPLCFLRSCSSPLMPQLMEQLESRFRVLIEAYGMTEASHLKEQPGGVTQVKEGLAVLMTK